MNKKKRIGIVLLVAALLLCSIGATIAWMTAENELTNNFTVGTFNVPEEGPTTEPIDPSDPDIDEKLNGHLYEPNWVPDSKIVPGTTVAKDPYVGIGKGSEDAYVYIYVENNFKNTGSTIGFEINSSWTPVEGCYTTNPTDTDFYTGGLFVYTGKLTASATAEGWTTDPLFSNVIVKNEATADDLTVTTGTTSIVVKSFIHQAADGAGNDLAATALSAAKTQFGY